MRDLSVDPYAIGSGMNNSNSHERRSEERPMAPEEILAILRQRVRERIRPVVSHLPSTDVDRLVEDIVRFKFKYEGAAALRSTALPGDATGVDRN